MNRNQITENLLKGKAVVFPTDTLPALAALPIFADQLWKLKRRPLDKPFILMGSSQEELFENIATHALDDAFMIAKKFWPGPLTMVLPCKGKVVDLLNPGRTTLGFRVPDCLIAQELLAMSGPLATTSANLAGTPTSLTLEGVKKVFPDLPFLEHSPWPVQSGLASTLISWQAPGKWELLRKGPLLPEIFD